jgi:hypothetical protein
MTPEELREAKSNERRWWRGSLCILVAILGSGYALWLRMSGLISTEAALFGFTCLFIFIAIVVYVLPQLQELNLKELKVVLREIKETENRIYATEKTVRELMLKLADLAAMETLNFSRLSGSEYAQLMRQWRDKRVDEILDLVEATPEEKNHLSRYAPIYKGIDDANALPVPPPQRDEAAAPFWQQLRDLFRSEISGSKSD